MCVEQDGGTMNATMPIVEEVRFCRPAGLRPNTWWVDYFRDNAERDWAIPWRDNPVIDARAWRCIAASIGDFQRGESSEARNYLAKSSRFAESAEDAAFHEASVLFVREENGHAALLLRFSASGSSRTHGSKTAG